MIDESRQLGQRVTHAGDVRRFDRRVAAGGAMAIPRLARHRRRVVGAIADHGDRSVLADEGLGSGDPVRRQKLGVDLVGADPLTNAVGCCLAVARQHELMLDSGGAQRAHQAHSRRTSSAGIGRTPRELANSMIARAKGWPLRASNAGARARSSSSL